MLFFRALYNYKQPEPAFPVSGAAVDEHDKKPGIVKSDPTLDMVGVTAETFKQILDYIYTSVIVLNDENIQVLGDGLINIMCMLYC